MPGSIIMEWRDYIKATYDTYEKSKAEYDIDLVNSPNANTYGGILLAVAHNQFLALGSDGIRKFGTTKHVLYDLKYILPKDASDLRL